MDKHRLLVASLALLLLGPGLARAADLTLSGDVESEYDSNVFRDARDPQDDVGFRIVPTVKVHEDRGHDFLYSIEYRAPLEFYVENGDQLNDVDQFAVGRASYHVDNRTNLFVRDVFGYLRGQQRDITVTDVSGTFVNTQRDRVTRNDAQAGIEYQFSPRLLGNATVTHQLFDTDRQDRADNWLLDASADALYALTPRHQVGAGARYIYQSFDKTDTVVASQLNTVNIFAQWLWQIDETLDVQIEAGPSWIDNHQDDPKPAYTSTSDFVPVSFPDVTGLGFKDSSGAFATGTQYGPGSIVVPQFATCNTVPGPPTVQVEPCSIAANPANLNAASVILTPATDQALINQLTAPVTLQPNTRGDTSTSVNVYAEAVLRKRWTPSFQSALRYTRTQGDASGLGGGVIEDRVSFSNNWDFAERWQLFARADWSGRQTINDAISVYTQVVPVTIGGVTYTQRTQLTGVTGDSNQVNTNRWGVAGRLTHLLTRNTSIWGQLTYNQQTSQQGTRGQTSDFNDFLATVGVRHVFEPIKLW